MGNSNEIDWGGNTLITKSIKVGSSSPGQAGTDISGTELTVLDGVTAGTATASKAVVLGASKDIATITSATITTLTSTTVGATTVNAGTANVTGLVGYSSGTGTFSSNAVTVTKYAGTLTTESLTTAHTAAATLVITLAGVVAGDLVFITQAGGTNTGGVPVFKAVTTTDTITITLQNNAIATNAFNGTFVFNYMVVRKNA